MINVGDLVLSKGQWHLHPRCGTFDFIARREGMPRVEAGAVLFVIGEFLADTPVRCMFHVVTHNGIGWVYAKNVMSNGFF